jgi:class 3 adenylate cyclase/tetratricopeptide (TPR) repeat protein
MASPPLTAEQRPTPSERFRAYVPRVVVDWLREAPDTQHRVVDGTLAMLDISGFTQLTERLQRRGKAGAEELSELLEEVFSELLSVAYADGASLLKWGGDAALLLFTGDGHLERACRASFGMQATLRRTGRLRTSVGQVRLQMSVGVHAGPVELFLVGDVHRELLVAGDATSQTVRAELAAAAGEVLLSHEAAAGLDPGFLGPPRAEGVPLRTAPEPPRHPARWVDVTRVELMDAIPVALRERLLSGARDPEHRPVTVAFVEISGTDAMLADAGPAALAIALHDLVSAVQQAALQQQVSCHESDIAADGVKLLLVGGAPDTTGTDEDRVLLTARAAIEHDGPLSVRVGINRGRVFSGILGPPYRQTFSIKGDAVNLAARVMGRAGPGQVLATAAVLERARVPFATTPLEPFAVKGKSEAVEASIVGPVERVSSRPRAAERSPLVGREEEMTAFAGVLSRARRSEGGFVEVVGEPGIGKSRLIEEVRDRAGDFRILHVDCEEYEASTPYLAIERLLRDALELGDADDEETAARLTAATAAAAPDLVPWLPLIGVALGLELEPTVQTSELGDAVRHVRLERTASALLVRLLEGPVLLIVEDAHWLDEASAGVLRQVAVRVREERWVVCMTRRVAAPGSDAHAWPATLTLELAPLAADAVPAFILASVPDLHLAHHEIAAVTERAGGNPLFLRELLLNARAGDADGEVPDSVEAVIAAQIDRLPARHRRLLRCVAVLGQTFSLELAAAVAGDDLDGGDDWRALDEFLAPSGAHDLRFTHALLRDVAYEGLPFRRRRDLHGRAGSAIVARAGRHVDDQAELLSLHFFHAQRYEDAWHYSLRAAASARTKWANAEAAEFYGRALLASRHVPRLAAAEVANAAEALGDVNERLGKFGEATAAYTRARRLIGAERDDQARLLMKEGVIREHSGRYPQALRWYTRALAMDDPDRPLPNRAEVLIAYAGVRFRQGRFREAVRWCEQAVEHAQAVDDRAELAHAYYVLHILHMTLGTPEKVKYRTLALPIYEELGDLTRQGYVLNNLGIDAYEEGAWDEALAFYRRSYEALARAGAWVEAADTGYNIAEILADQGHLEEAERLVREGRRTHRAAEYPMGIAYATQYLGRITARAGKPGGRELLTDALEQWRAIGSAALEIETEAKLAEAMLFEGDHAAALALLGPALERERQVAVVPWLRALLRRLMGSALGQVGDRDGAVDAVTEAIRISRDSLSQFELAMGLETLARLDPTDPASASARQEADELFARLGVISIAAVPLPALADVRP